MPPPSPPFTLNRNRNILTQSHPVLYFILIYTLKLTLFLSSTISALPDFIHAFVYVIQCHSPRPQQPCQTCITRMTF